MQHKNDILKAVTGYLSLFHVKGF